MSVAKAYARALYEAAHDASLGNEQLDQIELSLSVMSQLFRTSKEMRVALLGPAISLKEKLEVIEQVANRANFPKIVNSFLVLLARKERLSLVGVILDAYRQVRLEGEGGILGYVVSAEPMGLEDVEALTKAFEKKLGKRVAFQASTDPSLLAGVKVTVSGITYDGTLRSQLQQLRNQFVNGTEVSH